MKGCQHLRGLPATNGAGVFAQCDVAAPAEPILNLPVPADEDVRLRLHLDIQPGWEDRCWSQPARPKPPLPASSGVGRGELDFDDAGIFVGLPVGSGMCSPS